MDVVQGGFVAVEGTSSSVMETDRSFGVETSVIADCNSPGAGWSVFTNVAQTGPDLSVKFTSWSTGIDWV